MTHENTARAVKDVWICGEGALGLTDHMRLFIGGDEFSEAPGKLVFETPRGAVVLASPESFEAAFGSAPPHPHDGPHLAGFTVDCAALDFLADKGLAPIGERLVLPAERGFGTAVGFAKTLQD